MNSNQVARDSSQTASDFAKIRWNKKTKEEKDAYCKKMRDAKALKAKLKAKEKKQ